MSHQIPHLMTRIFGVPLLIDAAKAEVILSVLRPRIESGLTNEVKPSLFLVDPKNNPVIYQAADVQKDGIEFSAAIPEEAKRRKPYQVTPDGIAVINVMGTLVRRSSGMDALSGLSSYAQIESEFIDAATDPAIRAILLDVDSPGGEAGGVFDLANQIASARSLKPVWAVANDSAFSAAYALAGAAERVYVTQTGGVGSIGVLWIHLDESALNEKIGLKYTPIFAGDRKVDRAPFEPLSKAARADMQDEIDRLYDIFTASVSQNRGISQEAVKKTEAGLFFGENAVSAGLADKVGTFDMALADLRNELNARSEQNNRAAARKESKMKTIRELFGLAPRPEASTEDKEEQQVMDQLKAAHEEALAANTKAVQEQTRAATLAEAAHIAELCALGQQPASLAAELIRKGATTEEAGAAITTAKAKSEPEIQSRVMPETGTGVDVRPQDGPVSKACERIAARMKASAVRN